MLKDEIRIIEKEIIGLFSINKSFSNHLIKYEDDLLKEKYDHNYFEYCEQFTLKEFEEAINYQINKEVNFIKFIGYFPLNNDFDMESGCDLTMLLENKEDINFWKENINLSFKSPSEDEIKEIESKHYEHVYGKRFVLDNVDRLFKKMHYFGAYLDNKLVGICLPYISGDYCCIDEVLVDENYRHQYICTSMLKKIAKTNSCKYIFLHADNDDTPKNLYANLGFKEIDRRYICQITDLNNYLFDIKSKFLNR